VAKCAPVFQIKAEAETFERLWEQYGMGGLETHDVPRRLQSNEEGVCCSSKDNTIYIYIYIYILLITCY
jgi:hypothetical protein